MPTRILDNVEHKTRWRKMEEQKAAKKALENPKVSAEIAKATKKEREKDSPKKYIDKSEYKKSAIILAPRARLLISWIEKAKTWKWWSNVEPHVITSRDFDVIINNKTVNIADIIKTARIDVDPKNKWWLFVGFEKIAHGSDVLKLIQVFLLQEHESILDGNNKTLMQSIDGYFADNSLTALSAYQNRLRTKEDSRNDRIRWVIWDVESAIKNTGKENADLQKERWQMHIDILNNTIHFSSYGKETQFVLSAGSINVYINQKIQTFPFAFKLDKSSSTNSYLENDTNRGNMKRVISLMNVINRARYLWEHISNKTADHYRPFHTDIPTATKISGALSMPLSPLVLVWNKLAWNKVIQVQDRLQDPQLIEIDNLKEYLKPFKGARTDDFINFLNDIHEEQYRTPIVNKVERTSGWNSY